MTISILIFSLKILTNTADFDLIGNMATCWPAVFGISARIFKIGDGIPDICICSEYDL